MDKELLLKYIAGKASQKEKEDVATWIDADAANLKEFISLRKSYDAFIWQDTGVFSKKTKKTIASCYTTNLADCGSVCCSFRIKLCNDTGSPKRGSRNADCLCASRTTHIGDTC
jgi:hypothetical protein